MRGVVKWFSLERGYGFITDSDGRDYYFSVQQVEGAVLPPLGSTVEFTQMSGAKGLRAENGRSVNARLENGFFISERARNITLDDLSSTLILYFVLRDESAQESN
jgi:CspA family cold shock protein